MTVDLSKLIYESNYEAFKNDFNIYKGSISIATSLPIHANVTATSSLIIQESPQFSMFYAFFQEYFDTLQQVSVGSGFNAAQWYGVEVGAFYSVGTVIPTGTHAGPLNAALYPIINGNTITVNLVQNNPYADAITLTAQTIQYAYIEYTLAN